MKQLYPDLWQTTPEVFGQLTTNAYLLVRELGNVLFYSSGNEGDHARMSELGGVAHQYLSHRDEAGPPLARIKDRFGSTLHCHALERDSVERACPVDETFDTRGKELGGIEVIPTPGHTNGSTSYFYRSPHGASYLFFGDALVARADGSWGTMVLKRSGGSAAATQESLTSLRELEPDAVCASGIWTGALAHHEMTPETWHRTVDQALQTLAGPR